MIGAYMNLARNPSPGIHKFSGSQWEMKQLGIQDDVGNYITNN